MKLSLRFAILSCCFALAAWPAGRLQAAPDDGWTFDLTPYLWVASAQVDSSLPSLPPTTPPDEPHFESKLTGAAMLAATIRHGDFGLFMDYDWLRLNTESAHPGPAFSAVTLRTDISQFTGALTWRVPTSGSWQLELMAGVRFWNVNGDQEFAPGILPGFTRSADHSWTDPNIGAVASYAFNDRWFATGKLLWGGFGGDTTTAVDAVGAVGYRMTPGSSVLLGYRYMREDFTRDHFTWNLSASGFILGFSFRL